MSIFSSVKVSKPKRNVFDLSHEVKTTCNFGQLIPVLCKEVIPGDSFRVNTSSLVRLSPMWAPIMQRINVYTHFFFVPYRLLWDEWEDFITGGEKGISTPAFPVVHYLNGTQCNPGTLSDHLNAVGKGTGGGQAVNALPFKAYHLIWNEYYRDQNLTEPFDIHPEISGDHLHSLTGSESTAWYESLFGLRTRAWHKDYFTSALPWTQRGVEAKFPIGGSAPVDFDPSKTQLWVDSSGNPVPPTSSAQYAWNPYIAAGTSGTGGIPGVPGSTQIYNGTTTSANHAQVNLDPNGSLTADLSQASAVTINEFRRANALQLWLEKNARAGSRYIEQILSHFGVRVADYRLQRPEFLGGGKSPIMVSEVIQTSASAEGSTPQGNMSGHGISASSNHAFKSTFYEHGLIIGIMSILPYSNYMDGVDRLYSKFDKFDYAFPEFGHLGEQPIYNSEVYYDRPHQEGKLNGLGEESGIFGYTPRYAEYKFSLDRVHGDFKNSLKDWHCARMFTSQPALNEDFVTCNDPNLYRIFNVTDQDVDHFWVQMYHDIRAIRPLPKFGTPGL